MGNLLAPPTNSRRASGCVLCLGPPRALTNRFTPTLISPEIALNTCVSLLFEGPDTTFVKPQGLRRSSAGLLGKTTDSSPPCCGLPRGRPQTGLDCISGHSPSWALPQSHPLVKVNSKGMRYVVCLDLGIKPNTYVIKTNKQKITHTL